MAPTKMIQIRNVPEDLHRTLKVRAAQGGKSLSDYLLDELRRVAERPTIEELWQRIAARGSATLAENSANLIREGREERDRIMEP